MKRIPKSKLKRGWYKGLGRNSHVAYWTGKTFLTIGRTEIGVGMKIEGDCFIPQERIKEG